MPPPARCPAGPLPAGGLAEALPVRRRQGSCHPLRPVPLRPRAAVPEPRPAPRPACIPLIQECASCHVGRTDETLKKPDDAPDDLPVRLLPCGRGQVLRQGHASKVSCTTCHLFIKENAYSGRIVRNTDPRFCLLCHRKADFKAAPARRPSSGPPTSRTCPTTRATRSGRASAAIRNRFTSSTPKGGPACPVMTPSAGGRCSSAWPPARRPPCW